MMTTIRYRLLVLTALAIVVIHLAARFLPVSWAWGFDSLRGYPIGASLLILAAGLLFFVPGFNRRIRHQLSLIGDGFARRRLGRPALLLAALIIFILGRTATHFLGDGYLWLRALPADRTPYASEILSLFIHRGLFLLLSRAAPVTPLLVYRITSIAAGLFTLYWLIRLSRFLLPGRAGQAAAVALPMTSGLVLLFFGYVEHYPLLVAGFTLFLYYLLADRYHLAPAVALGVVIALHATALAGYPALCYMYLRRFGLRSRRFWCYVITPLLVYAGLLAAITLLQGQSISAAFRVYRVLPLAPGPSGTDAIFSARHLLDLVNLYLLIGPFGLVLAALACTLLITRAERRNPVFISLALTSLVLFVYTLVFDADKGWARDWDLFALAALPWTLLGVWLVFRARLDPGKGYLAVVMVAASLVHTLPWIILNADEVRSVGRFRALMAVNPARSGSAHEELSIYYRERRMYREAEQEQLAAIAAVPANARYWAQLGHLYRLMQATDEAIGAMEKAVALDPYEPREFVNLGDAYRQAGQHQAAIDRLRRAIELDSTMWPAYFNIALAFTDLGLVDSSISAYRQVLRWDSANVVAHFNIGTLLAGQGRNREAIRHLGRAAELDPTNIGAYYNLGIALCASGDYPAAITAYEKALMINPGRAEIHNNLGLVFERLDDKARAEAHYREALRLKPELVNAWNNLQRVLKKK